MTTEEQDAHGPTPAPALDWRPISELRYDDRSVLFAAPRPHPYEGWAYDIGGASGVGAAWGWQFPGKPTHFARIAPPNQNGGLSNTVDNGSATTQTHDPKPLSPTTTVSAEDLERAARAHDPATWARPEVEFDDGRFEPLPTPQSMDGGLAGAEGLGQDAVVELREAARALLEDSYPIGAGEADDVRERLRAALAATEGKRSPVEGLRLRGQADGSFIIEKELMCINGLAAWFRLGKIDGPDEAGDGYTEGAYSANLQALRAMLSASALSASAPRAEDLKRAAKAALREIEFVVDALGEEGSTDKGFRTIEGRAREIIAAKDKLRVALSLKI